MSTLKQLIKAKSITMKVKDGAALSWDKRDKWQQEARDFNCSLFYQGRRIRVDFWQGQAHNKAPVIHEVLDCLLSDSTASQSTFEGFCSDFGYDSDSRRAESIYNACLDIGKRLKKLLGSDYEEFLLAERE